MHYVYIIENADGIFYKGSTSDFERRLLEHNDEIIDTVRAKALGN
jgi:predicted GIY-YIG superfamily endonuclease